MKIRVTYLTERREQKKKDFISIMEAYKEISKSKIIDMRTTL